MKLILKDKNGIKYNKDGGSITITVKGKKLTVEDTENNLFGCFIYNIVVNFNRYRKEVIYE